MPFRERQLSAEPKVPDLLVPDPDVVRGRAGTTVLPVVDARASARAREWGEVLSYTCYKCGESGHLKASCPRARTVPDAPSGSARARAAEVWNMPRAGELHAYPSDHWLWYDCPWCGAGPMAQCSNRATGRQSRPHEARTNLVKPASEERPRLALAE